MTHEVSTALSKSNINLEIKRLKALQNQKRNDVQAFSRYQLEIDSLIEQRSLVITNSHPGFLAGLRAKMHQAAIIFDNTHKDRADLD